MKYLMIGLLTVACGGNSFSSTGQENHNYSGPLTSYQNVCEGIANEPLQYAQFNASDYPQFDIAKIYKIDCLNPDPEFLMETEGQYTVYSPDFAPLVPIYQWQQPNVECGTSSPFLRLCSDVKVYVEE